MKKRNLLSIVVPAYNEEGLLVKLMEELSVTLTDFKQYDYEVIFVNDGSTDGTWKEVCKLHEKTNMGGRIWGISFSRNFGKEAAIMAGLAYANGGAVITMDSDLQHPPEVIPEFIQKWREGHKIVEGIKKNRGDESRLYRFFADRFYRIMSRAVGRDLRNTSDYKLLDREVVNILLKMPEKQIFYRAITSWVGFDTAYVEYDVKKRLSGKSKWSAAGLFLYAVRNITAFSSAPLQIITVCSICFFALGLYEGVLTLIRVVSGTAAEGFATVIILQLISGSIIMLGLGLIGFYLSKIYDEIRNRPQYIIEDKMEWKKQDNDEEPYEPYE